MRGIWVGALIASAIARPAFSGDPKTECISAADQAQQARDDGKYRAAREGFVSCSRAACPKMVAASCTKWAREIEDGMPSIVLSAKDASGGDLGDARVMFDGTQIAAALDGRPVEVDPGSHKLRFERAGSEPVEQTVVIKAGEKLRPIVVTMRSSAPVTSVATAEHDAHARVEEKGPSNTPRVVTVAALSVVAAGGLAAGMVFGFASQSDSDSAAKLRSSMAANACVGPSGVTPPCQSLSSAVDAQNRDGALSVGMYVTGGVLAAVAIIAWIAWPKSKAERVGVIVGPGYGGMGGVF